MEDLSLDRTTTLVLAFEVKGLSLGRTPWWWWWYINIFWGFISLLKHWWAHPIKSAMSRHWMQGSTYSQPQHYEEVGWLILCSATFTPEESPRYPFYRRLSGPQDPSGHKGAKKNLHSSDTRDWTRAIQPVAQCLAAWATWPLLLKLLRGYLKRLCPFILLIISLQIIFSGYKWLYDFIIY